MRQIFSMARDIKDYGWWLEKFSESIMYHLLYLCFFPDNISYSHWRNESFGFIPHDLVPFKGRHYYPDQEFIEYHLYDWLHDSDGLPKSFKYDIQKKGLVVPNTFDLVYWKSMEKVCNILKEVSALLAENHNITSDEYFSILTKYGL